jgi:hypothetical protein
MKTTLRKCVALANAIDELKTMGGLDFRCAVVSVALAAKLEVEHFNELQKPSKGIVAFQEEIRIHRENCTKDKDGKKLIDVSAFMPLFEKSRSTHAKAIEASEKLQQDANKALDKEFELSVKPIPMEIIREADKEERIPASILGSILPFMEK